MYIFKKGITKIYLTIPLTLILWIFTVTTNIIADSSIVLKKNASNIKVRELFSIGIDEPESIEEENYRFSYIKNIDCDNELNLYVLDDKENCIKVFDKNGKFLRQLLGKGKGPREIVNSGQFRIIPDTGNLAVLQDYGYSIKEFSTSGEYIKKKVLSQQYIFDFEFISKDKAIFITFHIPNDKNKSLFKLVNLESNKIEKEYLDTDIDNNFRLHQKFVIEGDKLYSVLSNMELVEISINNPGELRKIKIPGNFRKNIVLTKKIQGGNSTIPILYNHAHPLLIENKLFILVYLQEYKEEKGSVSKYPNKCKTLLFRKKGDQLLKVGILEGVEFFKLGKTKGRRIYLFTSDPFPQIKSLEVH